MLDTQPHGLGHRVTDVVHVFDALGVNLPRLDVASRDQYAKALETHTETLGASFWLREKCRADTGALFHLNSLGRLLDDVVED